jgi:hypothetical protein
MMKKQHALLSAIGTGLLCLGMGGLALISAPFSELVLIIAFPLFVISLGLWWSAAEGEEDIPFLGY